ncbi:hypothetical protein VUJ46_17420 [Chryseobacterium sp. MYb264]|uniref:hypothetical protein n=1 Tax=Chryseobacterium sp. MYb264 TaxID=2745153 RepID=UPI002E11E705|nr:hypothetical protein VUJ46_17420 [Chryseobacterium sp. MYb264]
MEVHFKEITEENFNKVNYHLLFENTLSGRSFGIISNDNFNYKFSWQSDIVKPEINNIEDDIYSVGIDLNYVILDLVTNKILLNVNLNSFFIKSLVRNNIVYMIAETEVYLISAKNYNVIKSVDLPDVFEDIIFESDTAIIKCFGDEEIYI